MKLKIPVWIVVLLFALPGIGFGFGCPGLFNQAQTEIDGVTAAMKGMPKAKLALVHALLDDAKSLLDSGRHNHAKPQGKYDHARSMAKADSARGYANAARVLLSKM